MSEINDWQVARKGGIKSAAKKKGAVEFLCSSDQTVQKKGVGADVPLAGFDAACPD